MPMTQGTIVVERVDMRGFHIVSREDGVLEISNDLGTLAITVDEHGVPTLAPGSIKTAAIGDHQVTKDKLADDIQLEPPSGSIVTDKIANGAVTGDKIANSTINAVNLSDGSVTTPKLATSAVTTEKVADGAITNAKIANATITGAKIAGNTVATGNLVDGSVTNAKIGNKAVTAAKIADKTITTAQLADTYATMTELNTRLQEVIDLLNTKAPMVNPTFTGTITLNDA